MTDKIKRKSKSYKTDRYWRSPAEHPYWRHQMCSRLLYNQWLLSKPLQRTDRGRKKSLTGARDTTLPKKCHKLDKSPKMGGGHSAKIRMVHNLKCRQFLSKDLYQVLLGVYLYQGWIVEFKGIL